MFKIQCIFPTESTCQFRPSGHSIATCGEWLPYLLYSRALGATCDVQHRMSMRRKAKTNLMNISDGVCEQRIVKEDASKEVSGGTREELTSSPKNFKKKDYFHGLVCCREGPWGRQLGSRLSPMLDSGLTASSWELWQRLLTPWRPGPPLCPPEASGTVSSPRQSPACPVLRAASVTRKSESPLVQ